MNILILNGSPSGRDSVTLHTALYIQKHFPGHEYTVLHVGQQIRSMEKDFGQCEEELKAAELIIFCYPVYTFLVPAQLHRFIEIIKERGIDLKGKAATQISTSKHFYDTTAHQFIQDNCDDLGLKYVRGLSADMDDLLTEKGRKEALDFFRFVLWSVENACFEPCFYGAGGAEKPAERDPAFLAEPQTAGEAAAPERPGRVRPGRVALVADLAEGDQGLRYMIDRFTALMAMKVDLINIHDFPFAGGCLGCFNCASDGKCVYKDGFDSFLRSNIQTADAIVCAYSIKDHSMGSRFKLYDDRQFCNGHRTVTMGKPFGYLVSGALEREPNLRTLMEARAQVGGNYLAGVACDSRDADEAISRLARVLCYAVEENYSQPQNFYGVGGLRIFRDLIYQMQGLMREDHRFYKEHGFYDFPQKRKGRIAAMYLVGAMMNNEKLRKKIGGRMTEGMIMPYRKVIEDEKL